MLIPFKFAVQGTLNLVWTKRYECFFASVLLLAIAPLVTILGVTMLADPGIPQLFWKLVTIYLSILVAVAMMMNLGESKANARDLFWVWVWFSMAITTVAGFGYFEIHFFKWLAN